MRQEKTALVCGAGGFIGGHFVKRLKDEGYWVRGVDLKSHEFSESRADEFILADLRDPAICSTAAKDMEEVYQFAADMGGAGHVFTGENDAAIMHNSAKININVIEACRVEKIEKIFFSSSACVYPEYNQMDPETPKCTEDSVYPAAPDSEYGWEKLFSERVYLSYMRNYGMEVHIGRYHNIFGPEGAWCDGREKVPAALCRKVAEAVDGGDMEIWGDGKQTRSFLYIDECIEGTRRLMKSTFAGPVNIGSDEMVSIDGLADIIMCIAGKRLSKKHVSGPLGVKGRNSDNRLIYEKLDWKPAQPLEEGIRKTYRWIEKQVKEAKGNPKKFIA